MAQWFLFVGLDNESFDTFGNVLLLVSGVMLSMRSFLTVQLDKIAAENIYFEQVSVYLASLSSDVLLRTLFWIM